MEGSTMHPYRHRCRRAHEGRGGVAVCDTAMLLHHMTGWFRVGAGVCSFLLEWGRDLSVLGGCCFPEFGRKGGSGEGRLRWREGGYRRFLERRESVWPRRAAENYCACELLWKDDLWGLIGFSEFAERRLTEEESIKGYP